MLENPKASFLFVENGSGYKGIRIYLTKTGETNDKEQIENLKRRSSSNDQERFLVTFEVDQAIELIGDEDIDLE